jgi:deazaflavin-dependent oxidoreductase (nitroreductase family)
MNPDATNPGTAQAKPIPTLVQTLNPLVRRLLRLGLPMGQNALLTVRGRTSGELRSFPVTILETQGRRYVFAAFGEVNWVRNLRVAGGATLKQGRRSMAVTATELAPEEAGPIMALAFEPLFKVKGFGAMIGGWYGVDPGSTSADYVESARSHPAFELQPDRRDR